MVFARIRVAGLRGHAVPSYFCDLAKLFQGLDSLLPALWIHPVLVSQRVAKPVICKRIYV